MIKLSLNNPAYLKILMVTLTLLSLSNTSLFAEENILTDDDMLTEDEVKELLSGHTVKGIYLDGNRSFIRYHDENGEVRQNVGQEQESQKGQWFIDEQGRRCIVWSEKEKKCRVIMKDKGLYKEFTIQKNNKPKAVVIYKKIIDGNPEDL